MYRLVFDKLLLCFVWFQRCLARLQSSKCMSWVFWFLHDSYVKKVHDAYISCRFPRHRSIDQINDPIIISSIIFISKFLTPTFLHFHPAMRSVHFVPLKRARTEAKALRGATRGPKHAVEFEEGFLGIDIGGGNKAIYFSTRFWASWSLFLKSQSMTW